MQLLPDIVFTDSSLISHHSPLFSEDPFAFLYEAFAGVERLQGDNKYSCEKCTHLVEAERSVHYVNTPNVLTVHLKRFAAVNGYVSSVMLHSLLSPIHTERQHQRCYNSVTTLAILFSLSRLHFCKRTLKTNSHIAEAKLMSRSLFSFL